MIYSLIAIAGGSEVRLFWRTRRSKELARKEAERIEIQGEVLEKAKLATKELEKINKLGKDNPGGIAELIFYATGGYRREK